LSGLHESSLYPLFRFILARRWWVVGLYALLAAGAIPLALQVEQDNAIDRLIVQDDPDYILTHDFGKVFGSGEYVVLFAEAERPFSPEVIATVAALDKRLQAIPRVQCTSLFSIYLRAHPGADPVAAAEDFKAFATGTTLFSKQGLIGDKFYGLPLILDVSSTEERLATLTAIEAAVADLVARPAPLSALRRVGEPYVSDYLNRKTSEGGMRLFPVFGLFVVILVLGLYRSLRALGAFVVSLLVNVVLAVGWIGLVGGNFSIVSALVPMTILITCLATLVYIHSRFVERPPERDVDEHQVFALANKFLACTASIFATAAGFAALVVSNIRPIREMGVWVAVGLVFTWLIAFTLFPALQKILRTPTQVERKTAAQWFQRVADYLPRASHRWRWVTVPASLLLCGLGAVTLFGLPGVVEPMRMLTDPIEYVNPASELYADTRRVEQLMPGLSIADVWLSGKVGTLGQPEVLRGLDAFQSALEAEPLVGSAVGPTTTLRMLRYLGGHGDALPADLDELEEVADGLEGLMEQEALLGRFIEPKDLAQTHVTLVTRINDYPTHLALTRRVGELWRAALRREPALLELVPAGEQRWAELWKRQSAGHPALASVAPGDAFRLWRTLVPRHAALRELPPEGDARWAALGEEAGEELEALGELPAAEAHALWGGLARGFGALVDGVEPPTMVGLGRLQSKVAHNLVPTLTESFLLTVAIIFSVFLLVFRNGAARLMAMIPSLFAILVMFAVMRGVGMSLNVATILIASTVLGTSENDQIHFFYHFLERKKDGTTEDGLRHTMLIAGRSIFFATLINAVGFLAFALSDLPPIRQFGILAAVAFSLSMIADFTALPGALWMIYRDRPGPKSKA